MIEPFTNTGQRSEPPIPQRAVIARDAFIEPQCLRQMRLRQMHELQHALMRKGYPIWSGGGGVKSESGANYEGWLRAGAPLRPKKVVCISVL